MRIVTFRVAGERRVGVLDADHSVRTFNLPVVQSSNGALAIVSLQAAGKPLPDLLDAMPLSDVTLEAPIPHPHRNLFCVGKNYVDHAAEFAGSGFDSSAAQGAQPKAPIIFSKLPECVIASGEAIRIDAGVSSKIDYEAELGVIIGHGGRGISHTDAMDHVWGYTIINDVTARDLQGKHSQWLIGKSQDTFCPMGPMAVSADEIDLAKTTVRGWVNDELRQEAPVADLIFDIPTLIATLSAGITLMPGDVIATGTPAGVGIGFDPPKYLRDGDVVRIAIDGMGELSNPVKEVTQ
ncbi:MAG: fumarylacetoacetate hydrolase family protein [Burkholderiaceae bacterium]